MNPLLQCLQDNMRGVLGSISTWLLAITGTFLDIDGTKLLDALEHVFGIGAFVAAIVVSIVTALKIKKSYEGLVINNEIAKKELEIKDQRVVQEREITRRMINDNKLTDKSDEKPGD